MNYDISIGDHKGYVHLRVNKPVTVELLVDFLRETAQTGRQL